MSLAWLRPLAPRSREPAAAAVVKALVLRPEEAAADFVEFLNRSWREWFRARWAPVWPVLAARARVFADVVSAQGASAALAMIDPSVTVTAFGSVSIAAAGAAGPCLADRACLIDQRVPHVARRPRRAG
jgi:hypothetical protein